MTVLRESKYGGVSPCRSPEDKIGKGRCHHILGGADSVELVYNKKDSCYYVDISSDNQKLSIEASKVLVMNFIHSLEKTLDEDSRQKIIKFLRKKR